jgi:hypothetical protein
LQRYRLVEPIRENREVQGLEEDVRNIFEEKLNQTLQANALEQLDLGDLWHR